MEHNCQNSVIYFRLDFSKNQTFLGMFCVKIHFNIRKESPKSSRYYFRNLGIKLTLGGQGGHYIPSLGGAYYAFLDLRTIFYSKSDLLIPEFYLNNSKLSLKQQKCAKIDLYAQIGKKTGVHMSINSDFCVNFR